MIPNAPGRPITRIWTHTDTNYTNLHEYRHELHEFTRIQTRITRIYTNDPECTWETNYTNLDAYRHELHEFGRIQTRITRIWTHTDTNYTNLHEYRHELHEYTQMIPNAPGRAAFHHRPNANCECTPMHANDRNAAISPQQQRPNAALLNSKTQAGAPRALAVARPFVAARYLLERGNGKSCLR
jgi:predicted transcriptional regulator